jgi:hypothetical protein
MCHFLLPNLFLVIDNWATGVMDYEFCWRGMKKEWARFPAKGDARRELQRAIKSQMPLHPLYPFETKIMELSLIGYYRKSAAKAEDEAGKPEVIVRVGAEGGDVTVVGSEVEGVWRFRLQVNESSREFLDEDDAVGPPKETQNYPWVHSWPAVLALLDKYSWAQLCPLAVHPEFRRPVWHEVNRRLKECPQSVTSDELERGQWREVAKRRIEDWRQLCGTEG